VISNLEKRSLAPMAHQHRQAPPPWQRALGRFLARPWFEPAVGMLVMASVAMTLLEFAFDAADPQAAQTLLFRRLTIANDAVTCLFIVELSLRFLAAHSKRRFFTEFWLDILAVLPMLHIFPAGGAFRLLRLVRLLRILGVARRVPNRLPQVMRRGAVEYLFTCGLLVVTVAFGTGAMLYFEGQAARRGAADSGQAAELTLNRAFWFSVYSLFAGEPVPQEPQTVGGKVVAVAVMFMGLTIFAMFTGTVSAFMVQRLHQEGDPVEWNNLQDHLIICGWNGRGKIILQECRNSAMLRDADIVVIAQQEHEPHEALPAASERLLFLNDDFTRVAALEKAGIARARACVLLADTRGDRTERDADARTILGALTVEKLNPKVYTCAELFNRDYGSHLALGKIDSWVVAGEYGAYLLAHAAMKHGLVEICTELLTSQVGNEFFRVKLPATWEGKTFLQALVDLKKAHQAILVAVHPGGGPPQLNPPDDYILQKNDEIVVIAQHNLEL
jgi:voltage-gated potassium channel